MVDESIKARTAVLRDRSWRQRAQQCGWVIIGLAIFLMTILLVGIVQFRLSGLDANRSYEVQEFIVCRLMEWFLGLWFFVVGCCIGSFLNVVAYRVPRGLPITGYSFCPNCRVPIEHSDNVPVLGWFWVGGRCRACKLKISKRYPTFELLGGLIMLVFFFGTILGHGFHLPLQPPSTLAFGLPVNLRFMDERVFYIAALHAWLLFFLYAGWLTRIGGGRLPMKAWILGAAGIELTMILRPELGIVPFHPAWTTNMATLSPKLVISYALLTSIVGGLAAIGLAYLSLTPDVETDWLGACGMIGLALGWQAAVGILALTVIALLFVKWIAVRFVFVERFHPMHILWLMTLVFLLSWSQWHKLTKFLGEGGGNLFLAVVALGSIILYRYWGRNIE